MTGRDKTQRERIFELIEGRALTAGEISRALGISERDVIAHLAHVERSAHGRFRIEPSRCRRCGFVFRKRKRLRTPGRCPLCRSEEISETRFGVF